MAALSLLPSPHAISNMTSTRAPLRDAPSAVLNSPLRGASTATVGSKRLRQPSGHISENLFDSNIDDGNVAKKRLIEVNDSSLKLNGLPPRRSTQQTSLQRRLEAARNPSTVAAMSAKAKPEQTLDSYKQWQKHHRRAFPTFVFYFDSIQDDARYKYIQQIRQFGAREETFFSKSVTHVVTGRSIPSADISTSSSTGMRSPAKEQSRTINPSLLDNQRVGHKFTFEPPMGKKLPTTDIFSKARDMGMKIWSIEKFNRILNALARADPDQPSAETRQLHAREKQSRDAELSRLLREDKRNATTEKNWMMDMIPFRGCYIYIRDMDERSKPIMVRDYPKAVSKEQGKWPQLRPTAPSRCPFLEDVPARRATEPTRKAPAEQLRRQVRATTTGTTVAPTRDTSTQALAERPNPPDMKPPAVKRGSTDHLPLFGSAQASLRRIPRFIQGEPVASGVQPSNVTSAVRSQMISSTAALPGGKGGTSREFNALKRKVLEKNNSQEALSLNNIRAAINADQSRPGKRKALNDICEEDDMPLQAKAARKKRAVEKEPKAGYCENCRDKFEDFDDHIVSREHRKFALNPDHFRDLDDLLAKLQRI